MNPLKIHPLKIPTIEESARRQLAHAFARQFLENVLPNFPIMNEYERERVMLAEVERLLESYSSGTAQLCANLEKLAHDALACSLPSRTVTIFPGEKIKPL